MTDATAEYRGQDELEMKAEAQNLDGIFTGMCRPEEYEALIEAGLLRISYEGAGGFMGLSKLRATEKARA